MIGPFGSNQNTPCSEPIEEVPVVPFRTSSDHRAPVFGYRSNADIVGANGEHVVRIGCGFHGFNQEVAGFGVRRVVFSLPLIAGTQTPRIGSNWKGPFAEIQDVMVGQIAPLPGVKGNGEDLASVRPEVHFGHFCCVAQVSASAVNQGVPVARVEGFSVLDMKCPFFEAPKRG